MKTTIAIAALVAAGFFAARAPAANIGNHQRHLANVGTYRPMQAFSRVVADKRFIGYFGAKPDVCAVTLIIAAAGDETLARAPQRLQFDLSATQVVEVAAGKGEALGVACTADADAITVSPLRRPQAETVDRD